MDRYICYFYRIYICRCRHTSASRYYLVLFMIKLFIASLLLLSSCSLLPGTQTEVASNARVYTGSGFAMQVPALWVVQTGTVLPVPRAGTLSLALISPDTRYGFSNNLVIMRDSLAGIITSSKYAELNSVQSSQKYLEYTKLLDDPIIFTDTDTSRVTVFEAKYNPSTPRLKFIQTTKVCGTNVFLIHFSLALDKASDPYIILAKTFTCE